MKKRTQGIQNISLKTTTLMPVSSLMREAVSKGTKQNHDSQY